MKRLTALTAITLAVCLSGVFCSCKENKEADAQTTSEAINAYKETVSVTEETEESETESETSSVTTTASAVQTAQSVRETQKPTPTVFVPVAVDDTQYIAKVWSSNEESFEVVADAKYCVADFSDSEASGDLLNHSYWAGGKYVLDYDLPYSYEFGDDDIVHFYDTEGNETFALAYQDYILICNCVAHEYGNAYYVPTYERSLVAEVIMNRYWNWGYDSIYSTVTASGAFSGSSSYAGLPHLTGTADESVTGAVAMFFCNYDSPDYYNEGYFYFNGDGVWNHFRTTY